jgi:hypothetical protein
MAWIDLRSICHGRPGENRPALGCGVFFLRHRSDLRHWEQESRPLLSMMGIPCAPTFRCYGVLQALGDGLKISFVVVDLHAVSVASQGRKN